MGSEFQHDKLTRAHEHSALAAVGRARELRSLFFFCRSLFLGGLRECDSVKHDLPRGYTGTQCNALSNLL